MRLSVAFAALCAIPALALSTVERRGEELHSEGHHHHSDPLHQHYRPHWPHHEHPHHYHHHKEHEHKHPKHPHHHKLPHYHCKDHKHCKEHKHWKEHKYCKGHKHHKEHKHVEDKVLTEHIVCKKLNCLADRAEEITYFIKGLECGHDDNCWKKVKNALYELEFDLDIFDRTIDKSDLNKCFTCTEESKIACCYRPYADALIRLLRLIKEKSEYLEGEIDKFVLTAVNSLRAADSAFIYELGRRLHCEESLKSVMHKQGAVEGTTKGSIQEAFSKFTFTPLITGEHFKNKDHHHE
ncbi:hypothetical protein EDB80DRAFT_425751 [Ilyonectria destructans]|nr:hypothetical protein EDB80DRAFT_425751 [Ilyonectria destructans]